MYRTYMLVAVFLLTLTSCSYKDFEDSLRDSMDKPHQLQPSSPESSPLEQDDTTSPSTSDTENEEAIIIEGERYTVFIDQEYGYRYIINMFGNKQQLALRSDEIEWNSLGESIRVFTRASWDERERLDFVVDSVDAFSNITKAGLDLRSQTGNNLMDRFVKPDGTLRDDVIDAEGKPYGEMLFMVADVTVKNISAVDTIDGFNANLVHVLDASQLGYYYCFLEAAYFSDHEGASNASDYFHFNLPIGEQRSFRLGWFVSKEKFERDEYCVYIGASGFPTDNFVKLY